MDNENIANRITADNIMQRRKADPLDKMARRVAHDVYSRFNEWIDGMSAEKLDGKDIEDVYCWDYANDEASSGHAVIPIGEWVLRVESRFEALEEQRVEFTDESDGSHWHIMRWRLKDADA